jgi:hypothetical protein
MIRLCSAVRYGKAFCKGRPFLDGCLADNLARTIDRWPFTAELELKTLWKG